MVKTVGIIAEYNPFHNGHKWHIENSLKNLGISKEESCIVAVMSASFMQRGEPAIFDKWSRASMAVKSGVDLVFELPFVFSVRSAQYFAQGGVGLLNKLGIIDYISFGAENDDLNSLTKAAEILEDINVVNILKEELSLGKTYAEALSNAIKTTTGLNSEMLSSPNNILAIEYLRALKKCNSNIKPIVVKRFSSEHNDIEIKSEIASAKAIRKALLENNLEESLKALPQGSICEITNLISEGYHPLSVKDFEIIILSLLRNKSLAELRNFPDVNEGLEYKIAEACLKAISFEDLVNLMKSKRYLQTRLQRILMHVLLNTNKTDISEFDNTGPLYAKVLAFNDKGRDALKNIKENTDFPIIVKTSDFINTKERIGENLSPYKKMLKIDTTATDIYYLGFSEKSLRVGSQDFLKSPIYIK